MGPTRLRLEKRVIATVAGHSVAGGLELALWCDLRVMEDDALRGEFVRGGTVLESGESAAGAARLVGGSGRGGRPA